MELQERTDALNVLSGTSRDQQELAGESERNPLRYTSCTFLLAQGRKANVVRRGEEVATELRCRGGETSAVGAETALKISHIKAPFLSVLAPPIASGGSVCPVSLAKDGKQVTLW